MADKLWVQAARAWLAGIVCCLLSWQVLADCWEITDTGGHVMTARDIWQIKSRLDERSTLMGSVDNRDERIPVENVQSMEFVQNDGGWLGKLGGGKTGIRVTFLDGRSVSMDSRLDLFVLKDEEADQTALDSLTSVTRCTSAPPVAGEPAPADTTFVDAVVAPVADLPSTVRIYLKNGDILDGVFLTEEVIWKTEYALFSVARQQIKSMSRMEGSDNIWTMILKIGSKVTGNWVDDSIQVDLAFGDTISVGSTLIERIEFSGS